MSFDIQPIFTLAIARNQIMLMVVGIQIYWKKYYDRNGFWSSENCYPGKVIEVKGSCQNETTICSERVMDQVSKQIRDLRVEIIEALKNDLENIGARQHQEIRRRIEHLEQSQTNPSQ